MLPPILGLRLSRANPPPPAAAAAAATGGSGSVGASGTATGAKPEERPAARAVSGSTVLIRLWRSAPGSSTTVRAAPLEAGMRTRLTTARKPEARSCSCAFYFFTSIPVTSLPAFSGGSTSPISAALLCTASAAAFCNSVSATISRTLGALRVRRVCFSRSASFATCASVE